jgi:carboxyl-terminal processing protease
MLAALGTDASHLKPVRALEDGDVTVVSPIEDTSAAKAGLLANDLITRLDAEEIGGLTLEEVIETTRDGTSITLTIVRKGVEDPFDVKPARDILRVNPVRTREQGDVAYIKISTFNEQTNGDLVSAIENAKKSIGHKLKGYVIDLRNNPGGLLDQEILVSSDFLNAGAIVHIEGRNNDETTGASAYPGDITDGKRIVVLIKGGSASASEIVAGGLQDHETGDGNRDAPVRHGLGADDVFPRRERSDPAYHGTLLQTVGALD